MLMQRELNYLGWLASRCDGTGQIVELGCFLGGSTNALAQGLTANPAYRSKILSYAAFEIPQSEDPRFIRWHTQ